MKLNLAICPPLDSTTKCQTRRTFSNKDCKRTRPTLSSLNEMSSYWPDFLSGANLQPPSDPLPPHPPAPCLWCFRAFGGPSTTWKMSAWCRWRSSEPRDWWRRMSQVGRRPKHPNGRAWTSAENFFFFWFVCLFVYATRSSDESIV